VAELAIDAYGRSPTSSAFFTHFDGPHPVASVVVTQVLIPPGNNPLQRDNAFQNIQVPLIRR
jgi:hypothetical protein